jgi:hypothetical protein
MNDSKTAHRFKNKESERRSTRSRTDDPLDADKASQPRSGRRRRGQAHVKGISGWRLAVGNT